jgi:hypothetical protein
MKLERVKLLSIRMSQQEKLFKHRMLQARIGVKFQINYSYSDI